MLDTDDMKELHQKGLWLLHLCQDGEDSPLNHNSLLLKCVLPQLLANEADEFLERFQGS